MCRSSAESAAACRVGAYKRRSVLARAAAGRAFLDTSTWPIRTRPSVLQSRKVLLLRQALSTKDGRSEEPKELCLTQRRRGAEAEIGPILLSSAPPRPCARRFWLRPSAGGVQDRLWVRVQAPSMYPGRASRRARSVRSFAFRRVEKPCGAAGSSVVISGFQRLGGLSEPA